MKSFNVNISNQTNVNSLGITFHFLCQQNSLSAFFSVCCERSLTHIKRLIDWLSGPRGLWLKVNEGHAMLSVFLWFNYVVNGNSSITLVI